ncbi:MAG: hypothetical protein PHN56_07140 [Candidatus Nanoarchaeia archaeon]|nr:hypothetical protein [Candidatus Nanoarchaeia archaeon]
MLSEEKIKEAELKVKSYFNEGLVKKEDFKKIIYDTYMKNHKESLFLATKLFKENLSSLWIIVISYYSMFYIANAILYLLGYKIGSKIAHKITSDALIVFVRHKLKQQLIENYELATNEALVISDNLVESYEYERAKREIFQYETTDEIKRGKAKTSLERAQEFSKEIEKLINSINR